MTQILLDKNKIGKPQPWVRRKKQSLVTAITQQNQSLEMKTSLKKAGILLSPKQKKEFAYLAKLSRRLERSSERMATCAEKLVFEKNKSTGEKRLKTVFFCGKRLCPMCDWRKSIVTAQTVRTISEEILNRYKSYRFIFLTITVPSVSDDRLGETLKHFSESFGRLIKLKDIKKIIKGYFRSYEITRNKDIKSPSFGLYHPHIHCLIAVPASYFKGNYIKHERWLEAVRDSFRNENIKSVNVKAVKAKKMGATELEKVCASSAEVAKYMTNYDSIIENPDKFLNGRNPHDVSQIDFISETLLALYKGTFAKKLQHWGGLFKKIKKELSLKDAETATNEDLIHTDDQNTELMENVEELIFRWCYSRSNYYSE